MLSIVNRSVTERVGTAAGAVPAALDARIATTAPATTALRLPQATVHQTSRARPPSASLIFKTGPKWDSAKAPNEQAFFREHSANLAKLRAAGTIVMGARYADIGSSW